MNKKYRPGGGKYPPKFHVLADPSDEEVSGSLPLNRAMPHNPEAEREVIGCCLLDGVATVARCLKAEVSPEMFFESRHALVFQIILDLHNICPPVTQETLFAELMKRREMDAAGGVTYLMEITGKVPTTTHAKYFIEQLRECAVLRDLIRHGTAVVEKAYNFTGGLDEIVSRYALKFQRVADLVLRMGHETQKEAALRAQAMAAKHQRGEIDRSHQLVRDLPAADKVLGLYDPNNEDWMVVVAGAPGHGKSARMRQIVGANCAVGKRFAVFTLETSTRIWTWALAACQAHVNLSVFQKDPSLLFPEQLQGWNEHNDSITAWAGESLFLFEDVYYFEDIERTIRETDRSLREKDWAAGVPLEKVRGLDGVVIDYLQIIKLRESLHNREETIAFMSGGCHRLFKELNIVGFVGAQLNRKARDEKREPRSSDLRESGSIEQDADVVELLYVPPDDKNGVSQAGATTVEAKLTIAKRRNGPSNVSVPLIFHKNEYRMVDAPGRERLMPSTYETDQ